MERELITILTRVHGLVEGLLIDGRCSGAHMDAKNTLIQVVSQLEQRLQNFALAREQAQQKQDAAKKEQQDREQRIRLEDAFNQRLKEATDAVLGQKLLEGVVVHENGVIEPALEEARLDGMLETQ